MGRAARRRAAGGRSTARRSLPGCCSGIAATARLPLVFGAPFLMLVGGGGSVAPAHASRRRSAGVLPVAALLGYTWLTTGSVLHPGYDYQYQLEANGYPTLGYHPDWSVEDIRYVPQNLAIMLGSLPLRPPRHQARHAGRLPDDRPVRGPGRHAGPVRPRLPDRAAGRHRDEHAAVRARPAAGAVRHPAAPGRPPDPRRRADRARDRRCSTSPTSARAGSSGATGSRSTSSRSSCRSSPSVRRGSATAGRGRRRSCCSSPAR